MSTEHTYAKGDRVIVDPAVARASHRGVVYRVARLLPVNVVVEPEGGGRPMKINPSYLQPAPDADTNATGASTSTSTSTGVSAGVATVELVPYETPLDQGALVIVAGPGWKEPPGELYVVLRDTGAGRVSLVKLGGQQRPLLAWRRPPPDHRHRSRPRAPRARADHLTRRRGHRRQAQR